MSIMSIHVYLLLLFSYCLAKCGIHHYYHLSLFILVSSIVLCQNIVINEFLASNTTINPEMVDFDDYTDWIEAAAISEYFGGNLATITSEGENNIVTGFGGAQYIGLYRDSIDSEWKWVTDQISDYTNWGDVCLHNTSTLVDPSTKVIF